MSPPVPIRVSCETSRPSLPSANLQAKAEERLTAALRQCPTSAAGNRAKLLKYLVCALLAFPEAPRLNRAFARVVTFPLSTKLRVKEQENSQRRPPSGVQASSLADTTVCGKLCVSSRHLHRQPWGAAS